MPTIGPQFLKLTEILLFLCLSQEIGQILQMCISRPILVIGVKKFAHEANVIYFMKSLDQYSILSLYEADAWHWHYGVRCTKSASPQFVELTIC